MATINVYLNFNGNTEEAFNYYRSVFGGEFDTVMRNKDMPPNIPTSEAEAEKIIHISLPISQETVLMGSDIPSSFPPAVMGTNFSISVQPENQAEADKFFNALSAGGKVIMAMEKTFWGAYYGMCTDKFGIQWMINCRLDS